MREEWEIWEVGNGGKVAQKFILLYRRFLIGRGPVPKAASDLQAPCNRVAKQFEKLRYSRLEICVTPGRAVGNALAATRSGLRYAVFAIIKGNSIVIINFMPVRLAGGRKKMTALRGGKEKDQWPRDNEIFITKVESVHRYRSAGIWIGIRAVSFVPSGLRNAVLK